LLEKAQREARSRKVTLYRSYREGELPDIEIKHKELLSPLQSLAQKDADIARHLFTVVVSELCKEMEKQVCGLNGVTFCNPYILTHCQGE
jgi:DNA-dependent protein kinase catalytic subunit